MIDYDRAAYGDRVAAVYDKWIHIPEQETCLTVDFLASLAGDGPVLELGIGTGRVALPLAGKGLRVDGIDISAAMVGELRKKPGGDRLQVRIGDFAEIPAEPQFSLIFVVFNTFFSLLTQESQIRCFETAAAALKPGGRFVLEAFVPNPAFFVQNTRISTLALDLDYVRLDCVVHDPLRQRLNTQQIRLAEEGIRLYPVQLRYAFPSELDLMARLAGLRLRERWSGWKREPFTAPSGRHVSVYDHGLLK
jgi:SAM-dependent methyltransferase